MLTRRNFLKSAAAATAFSLASPRALGANERIRVAILGCRNRGHQVGSAMLSSGLYEIGALVDCDTAMFDPGIRGLGSRLGNRPRLEQDFRTVLEDGDIDAVVVASPDHWHCAMGLLSIDAGKHVFLEKPATYDIDEGKRLLAASNAHPDIAVVMGTQQRSGAHFKDAKAFIDEGNLGKIGFIRTWIAQDRPFIPIVPDSDPPETMDYDLWVGPAPYLPHNVEKCHYNWHFIKAYGTGEMGNWGAHWIDIARWYCDLPWPDSVSGFGGTYMVHDAKETPDTQTVLYKFPDITMLWEQRIWTDFRLNDERSGAEFGGEKGSLVVSRGGWTFYPKGDRPQRHRSSELMQPHVQNFADCIRKQATPAASMEEGHKTAAFCHMANITVELNRQVNWDKETETFGDDAAANAMLHREYREPWSHLA